MRSLKFALAAALALVLVAPAPAAAAPSGWLNLDGQVRYSGTGGSVDWANPGTGAPQSCAGITGAVDVAGVGGLFNCGSPGSGGAPPNAPALTTSALADPSIISAQFDVDPLGSDVTACGTGDPTTITQGGKNGDPIDGYTLTTGQSPDKDELGNVYAVSHTRSDTGHPELFFGAERIVNNGDSHIDFEFLQDRVTISGSCTTSHFSGHRTEGDLLAVVDFTNGGTTAGIALYTWHCLVDPATQPADGTVCDPSGTTPPEHYQPVAVPSSLAFLVNSADVPCGGWVCRDKTSGSAATIAARDLLEGGINLAEIPFTGCFNTFLPHTRTAQSFSATLADFTGPIPLASCRTPAISTAATPGGAVAVNASVHDAIAVGNGGAGPTPTGTVTFFLCGPNVGGTGCSSGGVQVGSPKPLVNGGASSDAVIATAAGTSCFRAVYAPDATSQGIFTGATHFNAATECFTLGLPAASGGGPAPARAPAWPFALLALGALAVAAVTVRRLLALR